MNSPVAQRLLAALRPSQASLALVAVASVLAAVVLAIVTWPFTWSGDIDRNLRAAAALVDGRFGTVDGYLYSPLAAALTVPLLTIPTGAAVLVWLLAKVLLLVGGSSAATRGLPILTRSLLAVSAISFVPIVHDLLLGNVTVILVGVVALVAWGRDRAVTGIALGIALAAIPKPALIPVLLWMLLWRPRALVTALLVGAAATLGTIALVGVDPYRAWIAALLDPPILSSGNFALSSWSPIPAVVGSAATIVATMAAFRRGEAPGLVCAICCGLLVSTYTVVYGAGLLLVAAPLLARAAPRASIVLALTAPVGLVAAFPVWVGAVIVVSLSVPVTAWPRLDLVGRTGGRRVGHAGTMEIAAPTRASSAGG